ncbi:unnamed protein product [Didymodactylos carnosus]|uniref:Nucleotidyl transferase domain-containing protein n=1 Tax=Didymodactylos carnosus TaxID=1234261 RepID=A0A813SFB9_9BILA|nr:unnamed protein product [Didymodactylos carnosus]CAF0921220.1 unnamed protein product [Didymodactylos carnosus]CAF3580492.1 unnamed protein product [Didymodactylos carnosus]CAF3698679.1 unnamed protein product [Didymodactylos carnosus]
MLKAVILIGGPQKGTRFRPLSLEMPKHLFPVAGYPIIHHLIESCIKVSELREILLIGSYQPNEALSRFIANAQQSFNISIRYLQEYTSLGTAGGIYHFRDLIKSNLSESFFVINGDICGDLPLTQMLEFHRQHVGGKGFTILGTEATEKQSCNYGCIAWDKKTNEVKHYVEKPETFVSTTISCGVFLFSKGIFQILSDTYKKNQQIYKDECSSEPSFLINDVTRYETRECIRLEKDVIAKLAGTGQLFIYPMSDKFWSSIKSAGSVIYANRHYLEMYRMYYPERLAINSDVKNTPTIIGDVFIHPTACVAPSAVLGPNVSIGHDVSVGTGVRIRESIILGNCVLQDHCCVLYSIIGWNSTIGPWTRVEGTPSDPDPNKQFSKIEQDSLFHDGKLHPSITVIGNNVSVPGEVILLNAIVLPHKELGSSSKNQIIL